MWFTNEWTDALRQRTLYTFKSKVAIKHILNIRIHTHTHKHEHVHTCTHTRAHIHAHTYTHTPTHTHTHMHTRTHTHRERERHADINFHFPCLDRHGITHSHIQIRVHTNTRAHKHTHTQTRTHVNTHLVSARCCLSCTRMGFRLCVCVCRRQKEKCEWEISQLQPNDKICKLLGVHVDVRIFDIPGLGDQQPESFWH